MQKIWEVGSEFDWKDELVAPSVPSQWFPENYQLFATGTSVLLSIHHHLRPNGERLRLHLPSFFCMHVANKLKNAFDLCWYRDLPTEPTPDFDTLQPSPGDLVLAVNIYGIRKADSWQEWLSKQDNIILIEDHSHDPFSSWARQSTAHYAMASLRKTLPIPDGAIIWSPQNLDLPQPSPNESFGAYQKLGAMLMKRIYINGINISKDAYRDLQVKGEENLSQEINASASSLTANILPYLNILELRQKREANIKLFISLIKNYDEVTPLFTSWHNNSVPFNTILLCNNQENRNDLRKFLISKNIFATVHWQQPKDGLSSNDPLAIDLSNRVLTIPSDSRYSNNDIYQIVEHIIYFYQSRKYVTI
ncbi:hypothetical protein NIES2101_11565 [Calothrix sp. HK-06]|nr:hypothetical protein NIES2101_11565 [Calothrix sp. HK-06]